MPKELSSPCVRHDLVQRAVDFLALRAVMKEFGLGDY